MNKTTCNLAAALLLVLTLAGCGTAKPDQPAPEPAAQTESTVQQTQDTATAESSAVEDAGDKEAAEAASGDASTGSADQAGEAQPAAEETAAETTPAEPTDVMILCTSDMHCGIDQGFGLAGLAQVRAQMEAQGYATILVDDGDAIQGDAIGTISKGVEIIKLMNALHYDVAIPGNHEFDYGMDQFMALSEQADFDYISCNFNKQGQLVFKPYVIKEAAGMKIAFVGVTTPKTLTSTVPRYFMNEQGEYIYGFLQDEDGTAVYEAVQNAVDSARAEGADYVYVMGHVGLESDCVPWTYADIISHTNGIDVFLDGHSHDTDQIVMKNKDGVDVVRSAVGTKLSCIGYSHISAEEGIVETNVLRWPNKTCAAELFDIHNDMQEQVEMAKANLQELLNREVAQTEVTLVIYDPEAVDSEGHPIRIIRRMETNLGDLCADAFRRQMGADIALVNGGAIRKNMEKGVITYGDIINVMPYGNKLSVIETTGSSILDALEWSVHNLPGELGGFFQVSGISFDVDMNVDSGCQQDENGMFTGITGKRRVSNVRLGDVLLDPDQTYTLVSMDYILKEHGDGYTMFDGAKMLQESTQLDNQVLIDYIKDVLGGSIGIGYGDPYGDGRIVIRE
ncbi:MAG: 5'-nucleotidase C-terminal domain-containing protein [Butyrivibrio sp.]|nr:5'-nucleotidase C-terminal domain-containing protein [Butyrivibrio sp.]